MARRPGDREAYWRQMLADWKASGQTSAEW
jgi:hypothetical protein